ncbi:MAG: DMT family transporter [Acidobacteriota bacterium]|nr:DMT family transporter [Acidobacteriota bacterium]
MMSKNLSPSRRSPVPGIYVAAITAVVSGVSIFVNSYGVKDVPSPLVYTTAKNLVAAALLIAAWYGGARARRQRERAGAGVRGPRAVTSPRSMATATSVRRWLALAYVGVVGGGLAFVLFFDGLARSDPAAAAFWRDTLVLEVALFAVLILKERIRWWNLLALALLVGGEVAATGGVGHLAARPGEIDVMASSALWAIEVIVARWLLRDTSPSMVASTRMGVGTLTLLVVVGASGHWNQLTTLDARQLTWIAATGALLALYVATWMTALARTRALDVTSVLVGAALITWVLQEVAGGARAPSGVGVTLIATGTLLTLAANSAMDRRRRRVADPS